MPIDDENRIEDEEPQRRGRDETSAEAAARDRPTPAGGRPDSATGEGPYVSEDGAVMGRDFVIPGVDPREHDPYRFHTGRKRDHGGEDAIEIIDLVKQFGRARILNGLNLGLPEDQVSMVLGPSGTGKSVLIKHIVGLLYPDSGDVLVHGESIPNMTDDELFEVRKKFGLLFQDGALFGSMNIYDNVAFPLRQHTDKSEEEIGEIVNRRLKEVGLTEATYKMPNELSGGMRKRAGFARALVLEPAIVMFDEPDSGLDPVRTALLCELIREVHAENGGCYLVISHDLGTARRIADFIAVLWSGKIVESGPERGAVRLRATRSSASSSTRTSPARSRWTELDAPEPGSGASRRGRRGTRGRCVAVSAVLAIVAAVGATQLPTDAGVDTLVDSDTRDLPRRRSRCARTSAKNRSSSSPRANCSELILTDEPLPAAAARGLPLGQGAEGGEADPGALRRTGRAATRSSSSPARRPSSTRRWSRSTASCGGWREHVAAGAVPRIPARGRDPLRDHQRSRASTTKNSSPPSSSTSPRPRGTPKARLSYLFPNATRPRS